MTISELCPRCKSNIRPVKNGKPLNYCPPCWRDYMRGYMQKRRGGKKQTEPQTDGRPTNAEPISQQTAAADR